MAVQGERPGQAEPQAEELLAVARAVVGPAAARVQQLRSGTVAQVGTKSSATDVVTAADQQVERELIAALRQRRPYDAVLGEEYGEAGEGAGEAAVRWLLDPIDGTVNYLYGIPWYAVSLAAEVGGRVVAGVVRNPATGQEWTAALGQGAWREGRQLHGSSQTSLDQALLATGFSYDAARRGEQARVVTELIGQVRDIRRFGAAALDLCLAAEGAVDAYYESGLNQWDYAAGGLIASEAGLTVAGLAGAPAGPRLLLAAPSGLFGPLHDRLRDLGAAAL